MINKKQKESSEELAYGEILKLIYERKFTPGDFLQEEQLSQALGMSRTPINRALSRMNIEGILERKKKKGCFIPVVTFEEGRKLFSLRIMIEGQVAWEAAKSCTDEILEELNQINKKDQQALDEKNDAIYYMANRDFHFLLAESTKNKFLARISKQLFHQSSIYIFFFDSFYTSPHESKIQTPDQHEAILQCVRNKDAESAKAAMEDHIAHTMKMLDRRYQ
ncbi:GntR family transcriptional regulator [Desulfosediminicola flagellatus]|uniref:GntR family transcriptional regulator n=1 Tax=Desulfosediminicola flagellatus TaxID=2569541 RepID=UPI0010AD4589|nr:GntR family transcriptional regulator [Desulfosediminicola flagellatus]